LDREKVRLLIHFSLAFEVQPEVGESRGGRVWATGQPGLIFPGRKGNTKKAITGEGFASEEGGEKVVFSKRLKTNRKEGTIPYTERGKLGLKKKIGIPIP